MRSSAPRGAPTAASISLVCFAAIRSQRAEWQWFLPGYWPWQPQSTSKPTGKVAIAGDVEVSGEEVNPVIRTLRDNRIEVTAVHSHTLTEQPRLIFLHSSADDDAKSLQKGLRTALDKTASAKS